MKIKSTKTEESKFFIKFGLEGECTFFEQSHAKGY